MANQLTKEEKLEALWQGNLSPKDPEGNPLQFQSSEAEQAYKDRILRVKDAIEMKKLPDRVPVSIFPSMFPWNNAGMTVEETMYDYGKCGDVFRDFVIEFGPDIHWGAYAPGSGKMYEILDYKLYSWPGHGVAPEHSFQYNEGEYMMADEYDALIHDPTGYFIHTYLPRGFGGLGGFPMLPFFPGILEIYGLPTFFLTFGLPPVQATLQALSFAMIASRMASDMASATLSGWPSVTDSDVNKNFSLLICISFSTFIENLISNGRTG